MFCPKCGTKNPSDGKFCRKCGTDINVVSAALTGKSSGSKSYREQKSESKVTLESAMGKFFMGLAFLTVAIILGVTGVAGGKTWWFWMLIPAFGMIGSGVAQFIRLRQNSAAGITADPVDSGKDLDSQKHDALPESITDYVSPNDARYRTGDLVPSSVVENTTRHLKTDSEGETMTLPNDPQTK
ncbi:MAG: zinc ribbon domain-containing protein [Pyrinomonadaceae bacterium]